MNSKLFVHKIVIIFLLMKKKVRFVCSKDLFGLFEAQWLSGRVLDSRLRGCWFEPHRRHCVVSLSKNINPSLVLVQPRKTRPFITERLLMGRKESNKQTKDLLLSLCFSYAQKTD